MENSFSFRDLQNSHNQDVVNKVLALTQEKQFKDPHASCIILEEIGWGLKQHSYSDETWNYLTFRSFTFSEIRTKESHVAFIEMMNRTFGKVDVSEDEKKPGYTRLRWGRSSYSIGD